MITRLLALLLLGVGACNEAQQASPPAGQPLPEQEILAYRLIESRAGVRSWVLDSDRMEKFAGVEDLELYGVHMDFYRDGALYSTLTSARGRANLTTRDLLAWGTVVVTTVDGKRLETEELRFDNASGRIRNDVYNKFTQGQSVGTGYGMEATPDLTYFELKERVDAEVLDEAAPRAGRQ